MTDTGGEGRHVSSDTNTSNLSASDVYHHQDAANAVAASGHEADVVDETIARAYWRANLKLLGKLLTVWFLVSYGAGILLANWLDQFHLFGFKLGFWFAQQGAIYTFVALIFIYVWQMKKIEHRLGIDDDDAPSAPVAPAQDQGEG